MVAYKKIYFELYTNDQYIWHKNNIAQLYFILGTFSSIPQDGPDIHRFSNRKWVSTMCTTGNL